MGVLLKIVIEKIIVSLESCILGHMVHVLSGFQLRGIILAVLLHNIVVLNPRKVQLMRLFVLALLLFFCVAKDKFTVHVKGLVIICLYLHRVLEAEVSIVPGVALIHHAIIVIDIDLLSGDCSLF